MICNTFSKRTLIQTLTSPGKTCCVNAFKLGTMYSLPIKRLVLTSPALKAAVPS